MGPLALLGALVLPITILNMFGGIVAGIWLLILDEWWALGYGLVLLLVSVFLLSFALMPGLVLSLPAAYFMSKESSGCTSSGCRSPSSHPPIPGLSS